MARLAVAGDPHLRHAFPAALRRRRSPAALHALNRRGGDTLFCNATQPRILAIGAHPDDIELGCGGLILRARHERAAEIDFLILSPGLKRRLGLRPFAHPSRVEEARLAAARLGVPEANVEVLEFEDCRLHLHLHDLIKAIELRLAGNADRPEYDLVLTHARDDTHADHRTAYAATIAATRCFFGVVMLYQSVSTIPNSFRPTYFVSLSPESMAAKQQALDCHASQRPKDFMRPVHTEGMAKSWAVFHRRSDDAFEAFEVHKSYWWPTELSGPAPRGSGE